MDDTRLIIGSANFNDRSMLGKRDSELAVMIDTDGAENDDAEKINLYVQRFRRTLMAEHLGMLPALKRNKQPVCDNAVLDDPAGDTFFEQVWCATAKQNTDIYEEVCCCFLLLLLELIWTTQ